MVEATQSGELAENEVLFKVDRFALTANNISYASAGDSLGYWGFFPAEESWGRIPAMGWGEVIAPDHSRNAPQRYPERGAGFGVGRNHQNFRSAEGKLERDPGGRSNPKRGTRRKRSAL